LHRRQLSLKLLVELLQDMQPMLHGRGLLRRGLLRRGLLRRGLLRRGLLRRGLLRRGLLRRGLLRRGLLRRRDRRRRCRLRRRRGLPERQEGLGGCRELLRAKEGVVHCPVVFAVLWLPAPRLAALA
jgi:hypothetical protein